MHPLLCVAVKKKKKKKSGVVDFLALSAIESNWWWRCWHWHRAEVAMPPALLPLLDLPLVANQTPIFTVCLQLLQSAAIYVHANGLMSQLFIAFSCYIRRHTSQKQQQSSVLISGQNDSNSACTYIPPLF